MNSNWVVMGFGAAGWLVSTFLLCAFLAAGIEAYTWESLVLIVANLWIVGVSINNLMEGRR
jgi:hypothetical protein